MNKIIEKLQFSKSTTLFLAILFLAGILRFYLLGTIPGGITHDELYLVQNAKSVFLNFSDVSGTWSPISFLPIPSEVPMSEFLPTVLAPFVGPFASTLFAAKFIFAIFGLVGICTVFFLSRKLFGKKISLISAFVLAVNPLAIFNSRTAYDIPISLSLILLSTLFLVSRKQLLILISVLTFFISFWGYVGGKILVLPVVLISIAFGWKSASETSKKLFLIPVFVVVVCLVVFFFRNLSLPSNRQSDLTIPTSAQISIAVDDSRKNSLFASPLKEILINKYTLTTTTYIDRFLNVFSTERLFTSGDTTYLFFVGKHGFFYPFEAIFLLLGLFWMFKSESKKSAIFLSALILVGTIPTLLGAGESFSMRSFFSYLLLPIIMAIGIVGVFKFKNFKSWKTPIAIVVSFFYFLFLTLFSFNIFVQNPIVNSNQFNFSNRLLSRFVSEEGSLGNNVLVFSPEAAADFKTFLFYSNSLTSKNSETIAQEISSKYFSFGNIRFVQMENCPKIIDSKAVSIFDARLSCHYFSKNGPMLIPSIADSGANFQIYGGKFCTGENLSRFVTSSALTISDFQIETMPKEVFCQKFVLNQN